ncbi:hypothetical protein OH77DRAFT_1498049 [Trametes cingulata]|nr:hypothetical protein OH77DRAFT_1498049 [Trametes cingulata]
MFSQPSSPVLKARRQRKKLYSKIFYAAFAFISSIWLFRYIVFEIPASLHKEKVVAPDVKQLAAVLLVTSKTIPTLDAHLRTLLANPATLTELVILTPQQQQAHVRRAVQASLSGDDDFDIEISIELWLETIDPGAAILQAARKLSDADWVLLLDEDGLQNIDHTIRNWLLLRSAPTEALPLGLRGIDYYLDGITCLTPSATPRGAAYLVPPLVMPTSLLPPVTDMSPGIDAWAFLGDYVSRSELRLSGGLVLSSPHSSSDADWCSRYAPMGLDGHRLPIHVVPTVMDPHAEVIAAADNHRDTPHGTFLFHASARDMMHLSQVACGLLGQGYQAVVVVHNETGTAVDTTCDIPILYATCGPALNESWRNTIPQDVDVVISLLAPSYPSAVHVRIPHDDLPYTDWMGTLNLEEWKNWHVPRIELSVITNDRPHSLHRLLSSLRDARYFGDTLDLRINVEQTADPVTLQMASEYAWEHGSVFLHHRVTHGGLLTAVVESWYPKGNDSYGLILEDDVELSPLFYAYLKMSVLHYRYGRPEDRSSHLFGISLYQQKNLELRPEGRHLFDAREVFKTAGLANPHTPYLSQIPCSWGALYFPEHWREFHAYLVTRLSGNVWPMEQTVVPDVRSNRWTRSWKKYFIELVYLRGYVMLYPNYADYVSLSTNHLEVGSHVKDVPKEVYLRKKKLFNLPLMSLPSVADSSAPPPATGLLELPEGHLPTWNSLPVLDLLGALVDQETISQRGDDRRVELTGCKRPPSVPYDTRDLLCTQ